jgi:rhamnosyltransferase
LRPERLAAVVTAYKPDAKLFDRFAATIGACHCVVVVDNTPGGHAFAAPPERVLIVQDGQNKGLGRALNLGLDAARRAGADTAILFDQDSSPDATFLERMLDALDGLARSQGVRAAVGPRFVDDAAAAPVAAGRGSQPGDPLKLMSCLPTSGLLFRLGAPGADQRFSEDLFLDFVDFDWCWRLGERGWRFFRAMDIGMPHRLGLAQRRVLGLTYHVPAPYRHYFQFRDTLRLAMRSHVPLYAKFRLTALLPLKALAYPFILDRGRERARWMLRGVADAMRRVGGIGAARELLNTP